MYSTMDARSGESHARELFEYAAGHNVAGWDPYVRGQGPSSGRRPCNQMTIEVGLDGRTVGQPCENGLIDAVRSGEDKLGTR
jgi:hypothetical protein